MVVFLQFVKSPQFSRLMSCWQLRFIFRDIAPNSWVHASCSRSTTYCRKESIVTKYQHRYFLSSPLHFFQWIQWLVKECDGCFYIFQVVFPSKQLITVVFGFHLGCLTFAIWRQSLNKTPPCSPPTFINTSCLAKLYRVKFPASSCSLSWLVTRPLRSFK